MQKNTLKRPRDRRFIEKFDIKQRDPAPPFGKTMINLSSQALLSADILIKSTK